MTTQNMGDNETVHLVNAIHSMLYNNKVSPVIINAFMCNPIVTSSANDITSQLKSCSIFWSEFTNGDLSFNERESLFHFVDIFTWLAYFRVHILPCLNKTL